LVIRPQTGRCTRDRRPQGAVRAVR
jgi:hypothetical protein